MSRRIVVSSNCQTAGIATALQYIFPDDQVSAVPLSNFAPGGASPALAEKVAKADIWVSAGNFDVFEQYDLPAGEAKPQVVRIPVLSFSAFHPDCTYLRFKESRQLVSLHYNSGIAAWGYLNGLDLKSCLHLFNKDVFEELGYLTAWEECVGKLKQEFNATSIDFSLFMPRIKRLGVFMHTINHPKAAVLTWVAQLASMAMGATKDVLEDEIDVPDGLVGVGAWPVYPEVGDSLGMPSSYRWRTNSDLMPSLEDYLAFAYRTYDSIDLRQGQVEFINRLDDTYDRVLGSLIGRA